MDSVDAWILRRLAKGPVNRATLERELPKFMADGNAFKAINAALLQLRNAGSVRFTNNRYELAPVKA